MPQDKQHKFVLVIGHESSGTRLAAETLTAASGFDYDDGEHKTAPDGTAVDTYLTKTVHQWWLHPEQIVYDHDRISRRSLPHGGADTRELEDKFGEHAVGRHFPDPFPLLEGLRDRGYDTRVVVTVRDQTVARLSKIREHTEGDAATAEEELEQANDLLRRLIEWHADTFVFSYEALMALGQPYLQQLYAFIGVNSDYMPECRDGNPKYMLQGPQSQARLRLLSRGMKVGVVSRMNEAKWGGDLRALRTVVEGLQDQGLEVRTGKSAAELVNCDFVFLSNTTNDQRGNARVLDDSGVPYGLIGFHEDYVRYYPMSMGFTEYVGMSLQKMQDNGVPLEIDDLWENPERIAFYTHGVPKSTLYNVPVMRDAAFCLAAADSEARTMKRDCPPCTTEVVYWSIPLGQENPDYSDEFLQLTGLRRGEYLLQVGRLESRKNQLATALGTKNLDMPLVFVATKGYQDWYELLLVNATAGHRKGPTFIVSEEHPSQKIGANTYIVQMPNGERLSEACLLSAYQNCGLHVHPAFWEAPGYTYLEAARHGVHTVASEWGTLRDYCEYGHNDPHMKDRFTYVCPYNLPQIEDAVRRNFGRATDPALEHPIFTRTTADVGREIYDCIARHV